VEYADASLNRWRDTEGQIGPINVGNRSVDLSNTV